MEKKPKSPKHWEEIEPVLAKLPWSQQTLKVHRTAARFLDEFEPRTMTQAQVMALRTELMAKYRRNAATGYILRTKKILKEVYGRHDLRMPARSYGPAETLPPSVEDTGKILEYVRVHSPAAYVAFLLQYESGLRPGEVVSLDLQDLQPSDRRILIRNGKTGMGTADISERAAAAIQEWIPRRRPAVGHERALILNRYGVRPSKFGMLRKEIKAAAAAAGVPGRVYPNLLRAALATHALSANTNPRIVQRHMRHKKLETTMIYDRVSDEDTKKGIHGFWDRIKDRAPKPPEDLRREIGKALAEGRMSLREAHTMLSLVLPHKAPESEQPGGYG